MREISISPETLADKVYQSIRKAIILGDLVPGTLHSVRELAGRLNVSRTPVREALLKLSDQGMVRFERNRGVRILQTTMHDLEQIFTLRLLLEVPATHRAAQQIGRTELRQLNSAVDAFCKSIEHASLRQHLELDARFHRIIMRASGNQRLADFIDALRDIQMKRGLSAAPKSRDLRDICDDHRRIYEHIAARNSIGAALAMREHIAAAARLIIAQETGGANLVGNFESGWVDLLEFERLQKKRPALSSKAPTEAGLPRGKAIVPDGEDLTAANRIRSRLA